MLLRKCRDQCPNKKAAGLMRDGVIACVVLLLACALMAGAVSAASIDDITGPTGGVSVESDSTVYNLTLPGTYTITKNLDGIEGKDAVILISANDVILDGIGKTIDGHSFAKCGIKVVTGYTNPVIKNVIINNTVTTGIRIGTAESGSTDSWDLGNIIISGVTIGNVGYPILDERAAGIMINFTESTSGNTLTISDTKLTGSITGENAHGMRLYGGDGDILVRNVELTSTSSISGKIWAHGIGVWSSGTGDVTMDSCTLQGSLSTSEINGLNAFGAVASVSSGDALITNCYASGNVYGKNYAYGLYAETDADGNAAIRDSRVDASMSTSNSNYMYSVALCDWWINNEDDLSVFTLENTTITNLAEKQKAVRILSSKDDGTTFLHQNDLTINLIKNKISSSNAKSTAFSLEDNLMVSEINVNGNILTLTGSESTALSFTTNCGYVGNIHNNEVTLGTSGSFVKSSSTTDKISKINWVDLTPGLNVPGIITWTGSDADGWDLTLDKTNASGTPASPMNYQFTDSFNLKSMTVPANDVVIDGNRGNGVQVTLVESPAKNPIKISGNTVTLKNLDLTASSGNAGANADGVIQFAGTNGKLKDSKIDFSGITIADSFAAVRLNGANGEVSGSEIINGHSTESSSQCIVVGGNDATITNNKLTPGKAKADPKTDASTSSGSVAVRVTGSLVNTVTITGNTITSTWSGTETTRNSGVGLDTFAVGSLSATITGNTLILNDAAIADNKCGGYGSLLYINPKAATPTVTVDIENNLVRKGTYLIYADNNEKATSLTVTGTVSGNDFGSITGKKIDSISGFSLMYPGLTWQRNIEPAVPEIPSVTPTKDADGNSAVKPSSKEDTSFESGSNTATIGNVNSGAAVIQISGDGVARDDSTGIITAPASAEIKAVYNEAPAAAGSSGSAVTYQLNISLKDADALSGLQLPTISPAFDEGKAAQVKIAAPGFVPLAMITATGDVTGINSKIKDSGIELTFTVPKTAADTIGLDKIRAFHVKSSGGIEGPLPVTITPAGANYLITVKGSSFSTYALAASSAPVSSGSSSSSGNTENAFRVLFETKGGSFVSPATGLSYGNRIAKPADPERDGYSFAGWYKDSAGTIAWVFSEDAVPGDISLYAKWVPEGSSVTATEKSTANATAVATVSTTVKQTASATQVSTASATTAPAGVSPTMTQAPAPVFGMLAGLFAAGVLIRRRE